MHNAPHKRRTRMIVLFLTATLLTCATLALLLERVYDATTYPGATQVSDGTIARYTPTLALRRTTVYRTNDPFNKVYSWYSTKFALGPESYAQSNCILMNKSVMTAWVFNEQMSVMACNTPNGQMMFVMRAFILR